MTHHEKAPYHFRTYEDGEYSFIEYEDVRDVTQAVDFSRGHENHLVDNMLVWGDPGRSTSGYVTDADFEHPAPGHLKTAMLVLLAALVILLIMVALTRFAEQTPL